MIHSECVQCKKELVLYPSRSTRKFCCRECFFNYYKQNKLYSKENNPNWKGGFKKTKSGYVLVRTDLNKYEFEHRLVAEKTIGRKLLKKEIVHHLNGIKNDNRPENLIVMGSHNEHAKEHAKNHSCISCGRFKPRS